MVNEGRWNLSVLYSGFDDPKYEQDILALCAEIDALRALAEGDDVACELIMKYIAISEKITAYAADLMAYANLSYSQNTRDTRAASAVGRVMGIISRISAPDARIKAMIARTEDIDSVIASSPKLSEHEYLIRSIIRAEAHRLSEKEEALLSRLNISGASAWSDLQSSLTSSVKVDYRGELIPLSAARNLAYSPDAQVRRDAYLAELECYGGIRESVAFALNSIKLQVISECDMRGYSSALEKALDDSRMKRETLDALLSAMREYLPVFRKYMRAKAKALGHADGLPWYELFAPMGSSDRHYDVDGARDILLEVFGGFDRGVAELIKEAFDNAWIDFFPREGKVGGAFDYGIASKKQSRVLTNFDGSFSDVVTLAHELGHAFHDRCVFANSPLNQEYTMPVAETASTFNEVLLCEWAIDNAKNDDERLMLIESQLQDATQIICDIYSRFLFEESVFRHRTDEFLGADRLCELMSEAQDEAYGDGLSKDERHPYMWLCKGHYYSGDLSFYNFPYAFGGLFARGLYAKYKSEGKAFINTYKKMLSATGYSDVEDAALVSGVDVTSVDFWRCGLESIAKRIDEFCKIVK